MECDSPRFPQRVGCGGGCQVKSSRHFKPSQVKPSQAKPSQAKPSQAKPSQVKSSQARLNSKSSSRNQGISTQSKGHTVISRCSRVRRDGGRTQSSQAARGTHGTPPNLVNQSISSLVRSIFAPLSPTIPSHAWHRPALWRHPFHAPPPQAKGREKKRKRQFYMFAPRPEPSPSLFPILPA